MWIGFLTFLANAADITIKPTSSTGSPIAFILIGRSDVTIQTYTPLANGLQVALAPTYSLYVNIRTDLQGVNDTIADLKKSYNIQHFFWVGHSMEKGGIVIQDYIKQVPSAAAGVILLAGFLQRTQRPDVRACLPKAAIKPEPTKDHPKGYLPDGVHDCFGRNTIDYPVPTLSVGGELDGVVRVTRFAEAFFTQSVLEDKTKEFPVVVVDGLNHALLLNATTLPAIVKARDLKSETSWSSALSVVGTAVKGFVATRVPAQDQKADILGLGQLVKSTYKALDPIIQAFTLEGSWFFFGSDDEHGASPWSAEAQKHMAEPMPSPYTWTTSNEFHMLSDEEGIPPYYRSKHRPVVHVVSANQLNTSTVCQPRYIILTVAQAGTGENGTAIIEEEKLNILTALNDTGYHPVSAIELATKLASRQLVYNVTGHPSPVSLDDGNRCGDINQLAIDKGLSLLDDKARSRFSSVGVKLTIGKDTKPFPPAGPWWIWNYLQYKKVSGSVEVSSWYAFYSLNADPYGAGNHYCKLLSPARVVEWALVDGLRDNYHI